MQLDQGFRQVAQYLATDTAIIDPSCFAAITGVNPAQNHFAVLDLNPRLIQYGTARMGIRQREFGRHLALISTGAH